ncbi:MAG TPA: hypothetical protein VFA24_05520 [Gaiellaceae bacterium]|nr:hypothetical protein [Gaiellaceae bacterium]
MAQSRIDSDTARISPHANFRLSELVDTLSTQRPPFPVKEWELVGALIYAAQRSPIEAIRAEVEAYRDREAELAEAVGAFLRAHAAP